MRIRARNAAERRNEQASTRIANGAVATPTSAPAKVGPAICAAEVLVISLLFASTRSSRGTIVGRYETQARLKKRVRVPAANATTASCQNERTPNAAARGTVSRIAARPRSVAIRIRLRRGRRSVHTPAGRAKRSHGSIPAADSTPIRNEPACSVSTAASGSASSVICDPKTETVCPVQRRRKSRLPRRLIGKVWSAPDQPDPEGM